MTDAWNSLNRDALLKRVTVLTAGAAAVGVVGAVGMGAALAVTSHPKATTRTVTPSTRTKTPGSATPGSATRTTPSTGTSTVAADQVQVRVLNGTGIAGTAHAAAADLIAAGFVVVGIGNAPDAPVGSSSIAYPSGRSAELHTLATATGVTTSSVTGSGSVLVLTVGPDWTGSKPAATSFNPPPAPPSNSGGNGNGGGNGGGNQNVSGGS